MQAYQIADIPAPAPAPDAHVRVAPDASLTHVVQLLVENQGIPIAVDGEQGQIDLWKALRATGSLMPDLPDTSVIEASCAQGQYSASAIARAIEDTDANLLSLLCRPAPGGMLHITLRIDHADPSAAVRSLERYGYGIRAAYGTSYSDAELSRERITALQRYLNI